MKTSPKAPKGNELLDFLLHYAKLYLASGGPTSRLEESLSQIGQLYGRETEVFATPTGIFVTLREGNSTPQTALMRLRDAGTNLGQLCMLEHIYTDIIDKRISIYAALETLKNKRITKSLYPKWQSGLAAFLAGFVISFDNYQHAAAALVSGAITSVIWFLTNHVLKRYLANPIFTDFTGAFLTLTFAGLAHALFSPLSLEAYALGGMVLLVPGLALTTAISELADQNLVSGTAKFMQATMMLLALGLAYLLFQHLAFSLGIRSILQPATPKQSILWISALAIIFNVGCFGVIFRVPPKALVWSTITGLTGWLCLQLLSGTRAEAAGPYLASVVVGIVSLGYGRIFRQPSQVYSVPGIVAMLPGMLALTSFRYFASGDQGSGVSFTFKVAITAVSIVFGLMSARIPFVASAKLNALRLKR